MTRCEVWVFPVRVDAPIGLLTTAERDRAAGLRVPSVRDLYVTSRSVQREVLARYLDHPPGRVVVRRDCAHCGDPAHGRPFVEHGPPYSVSHAGGWVMLAVGEAGLVGIDLEATGRDVAGLLPRVGTAAERVFAESLPPAERTSWSVRAWTRKEAAAKAVGRGLAAGLASIDTLADRTTAAGQPLHLRDLPALPGYAATLATSQPVGELTMRGGLT